ncbi:hypothetical protein BgiMline_007238 [Biomphalaria glabrata]
MSQLCPSRCSPLQTPSQTHFIKPSPRHVWGQVGQSGACYCSQRASEWTHRLDSRETKLSAMMAIVCSCFCKVDQYYLNAALTIGLLDNYIETTPSEFDLDRKRKKRKSTSRECSLNVYKVSTINSNITSSPV